MGKWTRDKVDSGKLNNGNEYEAKDRLSREQLNAMVNSGLYAQDFAEHLADTPDTSGANNVGTPTVEVVDNVVNGKVYKKFKFSNLKGEQGIQGIQGVQGEKGDKGDKGDRGANGVSANHYWNGTTLTVVSASGSSSADLQGTPGGFGTPTASATTLQAGSNATVSVTASGSNASKVFNFNFGIPKGADAKGAVTINGAEATVNFTSDPQTQLDSKASKSSLNSKADSNFANVTYPKENIGGKSTGTADRVIETYLSSDEKTWYRKWVSGWKECGMILSGGSWGYKTVTLPIIFNGYNYTCVVTNIISNSQTGTYSTRETSINANTTNSITLWYDATLQKQVYCCGY